MSHARSPDSRDHPAGGALPPRPTELMPRVANGCRTCLVNQDSGTDDRDDVNAAGDILQAPLAELGFVVTRVTQDRYGDHLVAVKPGTGRRRFLFVGHFDTVFPAGTVKQRPFRIDGSRAYGPGVYDMKGGLTALLFALRAHRDA